MIAHSAARRAASRGNFVTGPGAAKVRSVIRVFVGIIVFTEDHFNSGKTFVFMVCLVRLLSKVLLTLLPANRQFWTLSPSSMP